MLSSGNADASLQEDGQLSGMWIRADFSRTFHISKPYIKAVIFTHAADQE